MKFLISCLPVMLLALIACGGIQAQTDRSIVILIPHTVSVEPSLQREYDSLERAMIAMREELIEQAETPSPEDDPAIRASKENMMAAERGYSFRNMIAHWAQNFYIYTLIEADEKVAVYMHFDSSSGDISSLRAASKKHGCRFLVNFPELRLYRDKDGIKGALHAQLYDAGTDAMLVDSMFVEDDKNQGEMFACKSGTLECATINCVAPFMMLSGYHMSAAFTSYNKE